MVPWTSTRCCCPGSECATTSPPPKGTTSAWSRAAPASSSWWSTTAATPTGSATPSGSTRRQADALAQILGAPRITQRFADLSKEIPGLESARIEVPAGSPYIERPLGETRARTRTGASIVAVVSGERIVTSPNPDHVLRLGDVLVAIGVADGLTELTQLLSRG